MPDEVFPTLDSLRVEDSTDIFGFCNRLAWQIGGPVIIHDVDWNVVAYSTLPQNIDETRRQAILRRRIPQDMWDVPVRETIEAILAHGEGIFEAPLITSDKTRRVVASIYVGDQPMGLLWVAESAGELNPDTHTILESAAKQAAVFFGARTVVQRREESIFLGLLLDGNQDAEFLGQCLGIRPTDWMRVATVWHCDSEVLLEGLRDAHRDIDTEVWGLRVLCVARTDRLHVLHIGGESTERLIQISERHAQEILRREPDTYIAFGDPVRLGGVSDSRTDADRVMAYLCHHPDQHVGAIDQNRTGVTLMELAGNLGTYLDAAGGLSRLCRLEPADRDETIRTLDAYFAAMGTMSEAARLLHVHPNTLRYRLAKIADMLEVDLDDRETRLLLELELLWEGYRSH
jgi:hypothetical protein